METNSIRIENLRREFIVGSETVRALRGVSFSVKNGEFVTIMGASGSGKSTLLNILGCLDKPTHGSYFLDDVAVASHTKNELAEVRNQKIGFVFQAFNLLPRTSAIENVELPLMYNSKVSAKERHERAMEALKAVGLADRFNHKPNQLSGGQQQRVAIARALVNDPVMLLADEATGNLDTRTSYEILALFQKLNQSGKTIVFVTHELDIASFSARTITLKDGRIIKDASIENRQWAESILLNLPINEEN